MLWIKSYQATDRDPQTRKFCRLTGLDIPRAVGSLHMIWWWALDWAPDGDISKFESVDLADAAHFGGDPVAFFDALVQSGYVSKTLDGYEIVDWHNIGGQVIEGRKKAAKKKAAQREKAAAKKAAETAGLGDVPGDISGTKQGRHPSVPGHKELDIDKEKESLKEEEITPDQDSKPDQDQDQDPKPQPPARKAAAPDEPPEKPEKGKKGSRKMPDYPADSPYLKMANYLKEKIDGFAEAEGLAHLTKRSNMQTWANDFRLLVETDEQSDKALIRDVMDWLVTNVFWRKNVLSGSKFREQFPKLVLEMKSNRAHANKGSGAGRTGNQKPIIPIVSQNPEEELSEEQLAEAQEQLIETLRMAESLRADSGVKR